MISDEDASVLEAMEWDLAGPDPLLVEAVRMEVNRCQPWWRRHRRESIADMVGVIRNLQANGERIVASAPRAVAAVVRLSGRRPGPGAERLAAKTIQALDAIKEWGSR